MYLRGSDYDDDGDFQNGNADDETVSDMVSMIWPNDGDECDCEEYDSNVEAVMAMMRKELQGQRQIFYYYFSILFLHGNNLDSVMAMMRKGLEDQRQIVYYYFFFFFNFYMLVFAWQ